MKKEITLKGIDTEYESPIKTSNSSSSIEV